MWYSAGLILKIETETINNPVKSFIGKKQQQQQQQSVQPFNFPNSLPATINTKVSKLKQLWPVKDYIDVCCPKTATW